MATEKRLIKLQKRLKFAGDVFEALMKKGWSCTEAMDFVNSFQDADAVEAVRRKDCEFWVHTCDTWGDCTNGRFHLEGHVDPTMSADEFCCMGERRADG